MKKKVILLIDEYDTPLNSTYEHDYLEPLSEFMRNLLSAALKSNPYLEKGLMTGILRVSHSSLLSGLNNLEVYTLLDKAYDSYFGFTESEVLELIKYVGVDEHRESIKDFYNGYRMGYLKDKVLKPYWVLTSNDKLLKNLLLNSSSSIKQQLGQLISGHTIEVIININLRYEDLLKSETEEALWTLLLFCGYLSIQSVALQGSRFVTQVSIPNQEITTQYRETFIDWLQERLTPHEYHAFLRDLIKGRLNALIQKLRRYLAQGTSIKDFKNESHYHTFVLDPFLGIHATHDVHSNKESGLGFMDMILVPRDIQTTLFEFKHVPTDSKTRKDLKPLSKHARAAVITGLKQIHSGSMISSLLIIEQVIKIGVAFAHR